MSVRRIVISDTLIIELGQSCKGTNDMSAVGCQQQMEKAYVKTYKKA